MQAPGKTRIARTLRKKETWAEKLMWSWLRGGRFSGYKFRRQYPVGEYVLDFFCLEARVNVEVDGFQHGMPGNQVSDADRDAWLEARGVKVLRFWNTRLRRERQEIRDAIWKALQERAPHPLPDYCAPGLCKSSRLSSLNSPHPGALPKGEEDSLAAKGEGEGSGNVGSCIDAYKPEFPSPRPSPQGRGRST